MPQRNGSCSECGAGFTTTMPQRRYCSGECRERVKSRRRGRGVRGSVVGYRDCEYCGVRFELRRNTNWRAKRFCSKSCKDRLARGTHPASVLPKDHPVRNPPEFGPPTPTGACRFCGVLLFGRARKWCSERCRAYGSGHRSLSIAVWFVECADCGDLFAARTVDGRYCSAECRKARGKWPISPKKRLKVYERDGWICQICDDPVDLDDKEFVPGADGRPAFRAGENYPSVDHIVPRSRGGDHKMSNLRTAHHGCNARRGADDLNDQLELELVA